MKLEPLALDGGSGLGAAIIVGIFFGVLLVKSDFAWSESCLKFVTLKSGRLLKTFLLAFAFGVVGFYFANRLGAVRLNATQICLYSAIAGGAVSGLGLALCGFFPSAAIAAAGAGRLYAVWVFAGMTLAFPLKKLLDQVISSWQWGGELAVHTPSPEMFGIGNPIWPIAIAAVVLTLLVHFLLPDETQK